MDLTDNMDIKLFSVALLIRKKKVWTKDMAQW